MSKSVPITKPLRTITHSELVKQISERTCISETSVNIIINALSEYVREQLCLGNAIRIPQLATIYLRCRRYSEHRRATFNMNNAHLPEFCYYPYAEMSTPLRKFIATAKYTIDELFKNRNN